MAKFEQMILDLESNRKKLQESDSFEEISNVWGEIKKTHEECSKHLSVIESSIRDITSEDSNDDVDLSFGQALKEMEEISNNIENTPISDLVDKIKRINTLKCFCLKKLEEQKANMEEIK
jgi:hypothetical protein